MKNTLRETWALGFLLALCVTMVSAEEPRRARVLVVMHSTERLGHISISGRYRSTDPSTPPRPINDRPGSLEFLLVSRMSHLDSTFVNTMHGFDRDTALAQSLRQVFMTGHDVFAVTTTAEAERYLSGLGEAKLTAAARTEGFDFVLALSDDFYGLATRDAADTEQALLTPAFAVTYVLRDVRANKVIARGGVDAMGPRSESAQQAAEDRELFAASWPFMCANIATGIRGKLLRSDSVHQMAASVGRGPDVPAVSAKLEGMGRALKWDLKPAFGWREKRLNMFSRILEPKGELSEHVSMKVDVDLLIPELEQSVGSVADYVVLFEKLRREQSPAAEPMIPFADISAPGFDAFAYAAPTGTNLVLLRRRGESLMQVVTVVFVGDFAAVYPRTRSQIEQMISRSAVAL